MARTPRASTWSGFVSFAAATDVGRVRAKNEDGFAILPEHGLVVVADGMGGEQAGAAAASAVVTLLPRFFAARMAVAAPAQGNNVAEALRCAVVELSTAIHRQSAGEVGLSGMGATVVALNIRGRRALVAHMGDSRAYLFRTRRLTQLTDDHSIVGILLRQGEITEEEARHHPARGRLSRFVGMGGDVGPDVRSIRLRAGDRLLLCTDGLTGMVDDANIAQLLGEHSDPDAACASLVAAANAAGGVDNVTALVIDCIHSSARRQVGRGAAAATAAARSDEGDRTP